MRSCPLVLAVAGSLLSPSSLQAQKAGQATEIALCRHKTAIEFVAPMPTEEIPLLHGTSPNPESWTVELEIALERTSSPQTVVIEGNYVPSPGLAAALPTDINGDGVLGDPHPAFPALRLFMDDGLLVNGVLLPAGTNLASLIEKVGSEIEHGGRQSTSVSWLVDYQVFTLVDLNGDMATNLGATLNGQGDSVKITHGWDPVYMGVLSSQTPTITITTADWISTVDDTVSPAGETSFLICVEVRIPCVFDGSTSPPTPIPLDPLFGPCWNGTMACTGNFPRQPGPGFHPMFPGLDVRFSDDYQDTRTGTFVPGGVITGGQCGIIWGSTGASLAYAFENSSVHAWYGVNGVIDTTPQGGGDDQLIYRFTMIVDGTIFDTDVLPGEMLVTAAIESTTNCFSITNARLKHRPNVRTPNQ